MKEPVKPNRPPDYSIGDGVSCFWWEERINSCEGEFTHFNPEAMVYYCENKWVSFNEGFIKKHGDKFQKAYIDWLLEKDLLSNT